MESPRARRMGERLAEALRGHDIDTHGTRRVERAFATAVEWRERAEAGLGSDRHPAFLHPGRTVLILLDDVGERDTAVLAAAALTETRDQGLRVPDAALGSADAEAVGWRRAAPEVAWGADDPDADERLLEDLVSGSESVRRIVLAEVLDHLRHAHLWTDRPAQARAVALTSGVFAPLSERVDPTLARRYRWWMRRVGSVLARKG